MAVTYFQTSTASDLTGPSGTGGTDRHLVASRTAGGGSADLATGNMNSGLFCNQNFFTPSGDPGTDGTSTGSFTVVVRISVQNANIGIRVFLRRATGGDTGGTEVEASGGSQTAGAASRTFTWTNPGLGTWASGNRLRIRVQLTNTSGSMNQSATIAVDTSADTVDTPFTAAAIDLTIANTAHEHAADNLTLTGPTTLDIANATHAQVADELAFGGVAATWDGAPILWNGQQVFWAAPASGTDLVVANAAHAHSADSPSLTQAHSLAADAATQAHSAEDATLAVVYTLAVDNASQAHTADQVTLSAEGSLAIANATQAHTADTPTLVQNHLLAIDPATHTHTASNVTLSGAGDLDIHAATHSQVAGEPALTQIHLLAADNAAQAHTATTVSLTGGSELAPNGAAHAHTAGSPTLSQTHVLAVDSAAHGHAAGSPALTQVHVLAVADAVHGHAADVVTLTLGVIETPTSRTMKVAGESRMLVARAGRTLFVATDTRELVTV